LLTFEISYILNAVSIPQEPFKNHTKFSSLRDAKHLELFLKEYVSATKGYVVCQVAQPQMLSESIEAISWRDLIQKLSAW